MLIEIQDLRKGDEVLIGASGNLKYLRLLRNPRVAKPRTGSMRGNWITQGQAVTQYGTVKCSYKQKTISQQYVYANGTKTHTYNRNIVECTPDGHNKECYVNFNDRPVWLVKRNENNI
jgi:hypothetical protein